MYRKSVLYIAVSYEFVAQIIRISYVDNKLLLLIFEYNKRQWFIRRIDVISIAFV